MFPETGYACPGSVDLMRLRQSDARLSGTDFVPVNLMPARDAACAMIACCQPVSVDLTFFVPGVAWAPCASTAGSDDPTRYAAPCGCWRTASPNSPTPNRPRPPAASPPASSDPPPQAEN